MTTADTANDTATASDVCELARIILDVLQFVERHLHIGSTDDGLQVLDSLLLWVLLLLYESETTCPT